LLNPQSSEAHFAGESSVKGSDESLKILHIKTQNCSVLMMGWMGFVDDLLFVALHRMMVKDIVHFQTTNTKACCSL